MGQHEEDLELLRSGANRCAALQEKEQAEKQVAVLWSNLVIAAEELAASVGENVRLQRELKELRSLYDKVVGVRSATCGTCSNFRPVERSLGGRCVLDEKWWWHANDSCSRHEPKGSDQ